MNNTLRFSPQLRLQDHKGVAGILTGRHLQNITAVFRAVEIVLFLAVISRCSLMLPLALQLSGGYFRDLAVTVVSPRFVFVVGNAIVIILFVKSGGRLPHTRNTMEIRAAAAPNLETITCIVSAGKSTPAAEVKINCYRRSKSEKICVKRPEKVLRRTKTEKVEKVERCEYRERFPEDKMSSEEFRRTIEDFIARQQRFLREEEEDESGALAVTG